MPLKKDINRMKLAVLWVIVGILLTFFDPESLAFQAFLASGIFVIALMWKRLQYKSTQKISNYEK